MKKYNNINTGIERSCRTGFIYRSTGAIQNYIKYEVAPVQQIGGNMGIIKRNKNKVCTTCGKTLAWNKDKIYTVYVPGGGGLFAPSERYDAVDCECCGCQNLLQRRYQGKKEEKI